MQNRLHGVVLGTGFACLLAGAGVLAGACSEKKATPAPPAQAGSGLPESYWLASAPADAKPVGEVKGKVRSGDEVVVIGRVGGAEKVFVDGLAVFTIVDPLEKPCGEDGMADPCPHPWDYCCADPKELAAHTVTVELTDGEKPLKAAARGFHGLDHLKTVIVTGKAKRDDAGNVTILARGIHVRP